ncbi:MAG: porin family protein [Acidobacteriota bacterium]|jgi:opacity protein-like surface antigen|nr:porin family protein [Acidobacteriota bacterium]
MKKYILFSLALFCLVSFAAPGFSADFPRVEVFAGYSAVRENGTLEDSSSGIHQNLEDGFESIWQGLRAEIEDARENDNPTADSFSTSTVLPKGFDASVAVNINEYFGIEADVAYSAGQVVKLYDEAAYMSNSFYRIEQNLANLSFMAGPRFTLRNERFTAFAHGLVGINRVTMAPNVYCSPAAANAGCTKELFSNANSIFDYNDTGLAFAVGGGVDVNVNDAFAVRLVQFDYVHSNNHLVYSTVSDKYPLSFNNIKLSCGVVFRLGK